MSHAVQCGECRETVWPPGDAEGPGGQTAIAAHRLALEHVRESGHTEVRVQAGCYYVGDGERPTAFGDGTTDPDDVAVPKRSDLADCVASAARTLRDMGDFAEKHDDTRFVANHCRDMADAIETHVPEVIDDGTGVIGVDSTETPTNERPEERGEH